jgi:hypothetical protein
MSGANAGVVVEALRELFVGARIPRARVPAPRLMGLPQLPPEGGDGLPFSGLRRAYPNGESLD